MDSTREVAGVSLGARTREAQIVAGAHLECARPSVEQCEANTRENPLYFDNWPLFGECQQRERMRATRRSPDASGTHQAPNQPLPWAL